LESVFVMILILTYHTSAQKSLTAFRLKEPIIIDGIFEPEKWMSADSATQLIQMEPEPKALASEKQLAILDLMKSIIAKQSQMEISAGCCCGYFDCYNSCCGDIFIPIVVETV
jgi:hypothetical protein